MDNTKQLLPIAIPQNPSIGDFANGRASTWYAKGQWKPVTNQQIGSHHGNENLVDCLLFPDKSSAGQKSHFPNPQLITTVKQSNLPGWKYLDHWQILDGFLKLKVSVVVYDLGQAPCHLLTSKVHNPWPCCRGGARRLRKWSATWSGVHYGSSKTKPTFGLQWLMENPWKSLDSWENMTSNHHTSSDCYFLAPYCSI